MTGWENVFAGDGSGIVMTGIAIVFCGLMLISFSIMATTTILNSVTRYLQNPERMTASEFPASDPDAEEKDIASAIGLVMQLEVARHHTPEEKEEIDIARVISLVMQIEHEQGFGLPN